MKHTVCAIWDSKANAYMQPFFTVNRQTAMRAVSHAQEDSGSMLSRFPEDYTLFVLGEFDDQRGQFEQLEKAENLGRLTIFRRFSHAENAQATLRDEARIQSRANGGDSAVDV